MMNLYMRKKIIFIVSILILVAGIHQYAALSEIPVIGLQWRFVGNKCVVRSVQSKSAASSLGIVPGDIILSINDQPVHSVDSLEKIYMNLNLNEKIEIEWKRNRTNYERQTILRLYSHGTKQKIFLFLGIFFVLAGIAIRLVNPHKYVLLLAYFVMLLGAGILLQDFQKARSLSILSSQCILICGLLFFPVFYLLFLLSAFMNESHKIRFDYLKPLIFVLPLLFAVFLALLLMLQFLGYEKPPGFNISINLLIGAVFQTIVLYVTLYLFGGIIFIVVYANHINDRLRLNLLRRFSLLLTLTLIPQSLSLFMANVVLSPGPWQNYFIPFFALFPLGLLWFAWKFPKKKGSKDA